MCVRAGAGKAECFAICLSRAISPARRLCGAIALCEALLCLGCAHRARTAKLRAHGPRARPLMIQWRGAFGQGDCFPLGVEPSGCRRAGALALGPSPMALQWHRPKDSPPRRPLANGTSNGMQSLSVNTVSQCAPCARTKGKALDRHWQSAPHKPRAVQLACERGAFQPHLSPCHRCSIGL